MRIRLANCLLIGLLAVAPAGCEPRPVVDGDDDTTIIEEDDSTIETDGVDTTPAQPRNGVDVEVGGREGVDVNVAPGQTAPADSGTSGTNTDANR
jgi:hypothetical protein